MLQNTSKTIGFQKIMVYKTPPGGEVNHIWLVAYYFEISCICKRQTTSSASSSKTAFAFNLFDSLCCALKYSNGATKPIKPLTLYFCGRVAIVPAIQRQYESIFPLKVFLQFDNHNNQNK